MRISANQPFPTSRRHATNMNLDLGALARMLRGQCGLTYGYIVDSVRYMNGGFVQTGSGPNFQGGLITLCTCKHQMRSALDPTDWTGIWVAGFTGVDRVPGHRVNYLFYLMKVADAYSSQRDLWNRLPDTVRLPKAAHLHPLGDLYQPRTPGGGSPFDPGAYKPPRIDHSHFHENEWRKDIHYDGYGGRPSPLLVGDPTVSFLWDKPIVTYPPPRHPRTKKHELGKLLDHLT